MQKEFTRSFTVDRPASEAILLFTPRGEEEWVPGWSPDYLSPTTGETGEEMVFMTGQGAEKTFWTCLKWQPEVGHARYFRVTPQSRIAFVDVRCTQQGPDRTRVRVSYEFCAVSDAGRSYLHDFDQGAFNDMIDEWDHLIRALDP